MTPATTVFPVDDEQGRGIAVTSHRNTKALGKRVLYWIDVLG
jgi:hypothetical protein